MQITRGGAYRRDVAELLNIFAHTEDEVMPAITKAHEARNKSAEFK